MTNIIQGQVIAANSYQITLLIGQNGESASELYVVASIYLAASAMWWAVFRTFKAIYALSVPFIFYGLAFFFVGMVPFMASSVAKTWTQNVATAMYAIASASGSLYFAMNFGSEGEYLLTLLDFGFRPNKKTRWCCCRIMGIPCLCDPRNPANLRQRSLVLGFHSIQEGCTRSINCFAHDVAETRRCSNYSHCGVPLVSGRSSVLWTS